MDTRPPPPQGQSRFPFTNRVYRTNLRPVIIGIGSLSALWSLLSGIGYFRSSNFDKDQNVPKLVTFAIVLGAMYMAMTAIETFGVIAALSRRLALIRLYAILSVVAVLITAAAGVTQIVVHFTAKDDILKLCTSLTNGLRTAVYPFGIFGPSHHETIDAQEAADWCRRSYDRNSWEDIISVLILIALSCSFAVLALAYYRQALDPTSVANALRAPSNQTRMGNFPQHYNPPYNASVPNLGYGYNQPYPNAQYNGGPPQPTYAPPPGAPPQVSRDAPFAPPENKPGYTGARPGYGEDDKENPFADFDEREHDVTSRAGERNFRT